MLEQDEVVIILRQQEVLVDRLDGGAHLRLHDLGQFFPGLISEDRMETFNVDGVLGNVHHKVDEVLDVGSARVQVFEGKVRG